MKRPIKFAVISLSAAMAAPILLACASEADVEAAKAVAKAHGYAVTVATSIMDETQKPDGDGISTFIESGLHDSVNNIGNFIFYPEPGKENMELHCDYRITDLNGRQFDYTNFIIIQMTEDQVSEFYDLTGLQLSEAEMKRGLEEGHWVNPTIRISTGGMLYNSKGDYSPEVSTEIYHFMADLMKESQSKGQMSVYVAKAGKEIKPEAASAYEAKAVTVGDAEVKGAVVNVPVSLYKYDVNSPEVGVTQYQVVFSLLGYSKNPSEVFGGALQDAINDFKKAIISNHGQLLSYNGTGYMVEIVSQSTVPAVDGLVNAYHELKEEDLTQRVLSRKEAEPQQ